MLANAKYIYALDMWTVQKRPNGWYFSKSAYHGDKHEWPGPYASEMSLTLIIARELPEGNQPTPQTVTPIPRHSNPAISTCGAFLFLLKVIRDESESPTQRVAVPS